MMLSVDEARRRILADTAPLGTERVALARAGGRIAAERVIAGRSQPPCAVSAMDGYAVRAADIARLPARLQLTGSVAAGHVFPDRIGPGDAVRIFTGAPVPDGADTIIIQENTRIPALCEGDSPVVEILEAPLRGAFVRPAGLDYMPGAELAWPGLRLDYRHIALIASAGRGDILTYRRARVGLLATGDELVRPGMATAPAQISASSLIALIVFVEENGGIAIDLGIAADNQRDLVNKITQARRQEVDILVTLGGASVGAHDLVRDALGACGMNLDFWRVAMRPGKPLMAGRTGATHMLGFPGNPVSSLVCAVLYLRPLLARLHGAGKGGGDEIWIDAIAGRALPENDRRADYLRADLECRSDGVWVATPFENQDSSVLSVMARASCLVLRDPFAPALAAGAPIRVMPLFGPPGARWPSGHARMPAPGPAPGPAPWPSPRPRLLRTRRLNDIS